MNSAKVILLSLSMSTFLKIFMQIVLDLSLSDTKSVYDYISSEILKNPSLSRSKDLKTE